MGLTASAVVATQMIMLFRPRLICMVGVAAGTKSKNRNYGDILIANPSVDYSSGKITMIGGEEIFEPDPFPIPLEASLATAVKDEQRQRLGLDDIQKGWGQNAENRLNIHIGPLGAADQVVDSKSRVAAAKQNWRKLIGVEMEAYAIYRAASEAPFPRPFFICFKSVCDFAQQKKDDWQEYAAYTAAAYAKQFVLRNWKQIESWSKGSFK